MLFTFDGGELDGPKGRKRIKLDTQEIDRKDKLRALFLGWSKGGIMGKAFLYSDDRQIPAHEHCTQLVSSSFVRELPIHLYSAI